ncbi:MAG: ABC transporter ATP-binding protein [Fusobacterium sp.]|nr:ABC transporter ATP-binding protein [Fusobacterium sp.]
MPNRNPILAAKDISIQFGALKAVSDFNLEIFENDLVGLIGPNGAGKTTIFNILTGVYNSTSGEYYFDGNLIKNSSTATLVKNGLARTFQNIRLFKYLTVLDNVMVAHNFNMKYGMLSGMFRSPSYWKEEKEIRKKSMELLKIFNLDKYAEQAAGNLPYGEQRKLEIARAMATNPKLLLLDEPAAGMNPTETEELMQTIKLIRDTFGIAILLIEHDMKLVLGICEKLVVLDHGTVLASGVPTEVINNPKVVAAYLGEDTDDELGEGEVEK